MMNDITVTDAEVLEIFDDGINIEVTRRTGKFWGKTKETIKVLAVPMTRRTDLFKFKDDELSLAMLYTRMSEKQLAALTEESYDLILQTGHELNSKQLEKGGQAAKKLAAAVSQMFNG